MERDEMVCFFVTEEERLDGHANTTVLMREGERGGIHSILER